MRLPISYKFDRVVMLNSLPLEDQGVLRRTREHIEDLVYTLTDVELESVTVDSATKFEEYMNILAAETSVDRVPLIHLDMHGSREHGLALKSGEFIEWRDAAKMLASLNCRTKNQMLVVACACFAIEVIHPPNLREPSPFCLLLAPENELETSFIENEIFKFYNIILRERDINAAIEEVTHGLYPFFPEQILLSVLRNVYWGYDEGKFGLNREKSIETIHKDILCVEDVSIEHVKKSIEQFGRNLDESSLNALVDTYMCSRAPCFTVKDISRPENALVQGCEVNHDNE